MLEEVEIYGLFLIDRRECTIGLLTGKRIEPISYLTSRVPGKHGRGGQSQRRFERLIEIAAHEWFVKCAEKANEIFKDQKGLKGILIGGPGPTKRSFINDNYLANPIQEKILGIFDTGYTDDYGLKELVNNAADSLDKLEISIEKKIMQNFLGKIREDHGLAVYGEKEVRKSLEMGALDILLLSEGLRKYHVWEECKSCGYKTDKIKKQIKEDTCPDCSSQLTVTKKIDVIDELSEKADETKAKVEIISLESEEGDTLLKAFGGIAGILRYEVPITKMVK
jgi:peptide chain release factor subunit 1